MKFKMVDKKAKKVNNKDYYLRYDELCLYFDYFNNNFELFFNGEIINGTTFTLKPTLDDIAKNIKPNEKLVCFVNNLDYISDFLGLAFENTVTKESGKTYKLTASNDNFEFRNYSAFFCTPGGKGVGGSVEMVNFLRKIAELCGKDNIVYCKYSIGHMTQEILAHDIEKDIRAWNIDNRNFIDNIYHYQDQLVGCKKGLLKCEPGTYDDISMFDIKSAYVAAFVQLDCFPIGRIYHYSGDKAMKTILENNYFQIIVQTEEPIAEFEDYGVDNRYGFLFFDVATLWLTKKIDVIGKIIELSENPKNEISCYISTSYGRLSDKILDKIMMFYDMKQNPENTPEERSAYKAIVQQVYGKALQEHEFKSNHEVFAHYLNIPKNYFRPWYSMLASSYVRYKIANISEKLDNVIYYDTDGIEATYSEKNVAVIEDHNNKIMKYNETIGFKSDIGTFEIEELHAKTRIIARKQRIYLDDEGKLHVKIAGFNGLKLLQDCFESDDELFNYLSFVSTLPTIKTKFSDDKGFYRVIKNITLQGCCQEGS